MWSISKILQTRSRFLRRAVLTQNYSESRYYHMRSIFAGFKPQTGISESFFDDNMEMSNLRNQVSDLQLSRDTLQEQVTTKDDKIQKLVSRAEI